MEEKERARREKLVKKTVARASDYKRTFSTEHGKRVLLDIMDVGFFKKSTYIQGDAMGTAFNEGHRNMVIRLLTFMNMDIDEVEKLLRETSGYDS